MEYTQPPPLTEKEIEQFLHDGKIGRLCTHNVDGSIHAVPVWYNYEAGKIILGSPVKSRKTRNMQRKRTVTFLVDVEGPPTRGVIVYGKAHLETGKTCDEMAKTALSIFERYMTKDEAVVYWSGLSKLTQWVTVIISPKKIVSFDYGKDTRYRAATKDEL